MVCALPGQVRSLVLDSLDPVDLGVLRRMGNERANAVWEHKLLDGWVKPQAAETRATKENYIKAKYTWKGFIEIEEDEALSPGLSRTEHYSRKLVTAAAEDDLEGTLRALVSGGDLKWADPSRHDRTALHVAAAQGHAEVVAFLLQNGAETGVKDGHGMTPADLAGWATNQEAIRYLTR